MVESGEGGASGQNSPKKGEFFVISPELGGPGHWVEFENADKLRPRDQVFIRPITGGFPPLCEVPVLRQTHPDYGPNDLDSLFEDYWLVSAELKTVLEAVDTDGVAFAKCVYYLHDGSLGPEFYLCDVTRFLDAIDDDASEVEIITEGMALGKYYEIGLGARLAFKMDVVGQSRIFRNKYNESLVVCDRVMRDALAERGFGAGGYGRGVYLDDAAEYFLGDAQ